MRAHIRELNYSEIILEYFQEYKKFMQVDFLPDFDTETFSFFKPNNTTKASMSPPENETSKYKLAIAKELVSQNSIQTKALLFHEFTHLYDHYKWTPTLYGEQGRKEGEFYSEVHASIIKLMTSFRFEDIDDTKDVCFKDEIYFRNKLVTLEIFMLEHQCGIMELISSALTTPTEKIIERIVKHTMYYYGYLIFCNNFVKEDLSQFSDISSFNSFFGDKIVEAYDIVEKYKSIDEIKIKALQEIRVYIKGFACYRFLTKKNF